VKQTEIGKYFQTMGSKDITMKVIAQGHFFMLYLIVEPKFPKSVHEE
jgi:hypothetical protein